MTSFRPVGQRWWGSEGRAVFVVPIWVNRICIDPVIQGYAPEGRDFGRRPAV